MTAPHRLPASTRRPGAPSDADLVATILLTAATLTLSLLIAFGTLLTWFVETTCGSDCEPATSPTMYAVILGGVATGLATTLAGTLRSLTHRRPAFYWPVLGASIIVTTWASAIALDT